MWYQGLVAVLTLNQKGVAAVECWPTLQADVGGESTVELASGRKRAAAAERMKLLNELAADGVRLRDFWYEFCLRRRGWYIAMLRSNCNGLSGVASELLRSGLKRRRLDGIILSFADVMGRMMIRDTERIYCRAAFLNFLRCPAHHEALVTIAEGECEPRESCSAVRENFARVMEGCSLRQ
jgi:hypothetical protein